MVCSPLPESHRRQLTHYDHRNSRFGADVSEEPLLPHLNNSPSPLDERIEAQPDFRLASYCSEVRVPFRAARVSFTSAELEYRKYWFTTPTA